jgi:hypothetical protein
MTGNRRKDRTGNSVIPVSLCLRFFAETLQSTTGLIPATAASRPDIRVDGSAGLGRAREVGRHGVTRSARIWVGGSPVLPLRPRLSDRTGLVYLKKLLPLWGGPVAVLPIAPLSTDDACRNQRRKRGGISTFGFD